MNFVKLLRLLTIFFSKRQAMYTYMPLIVLHAFFKSARLLNARIFALRIIMNYKSKKCMPSIFALHIKDLDRIISLILNWCDVPSKTNKSELVWRGLGRKKNVKKTVVYKFVQ